jgi:hypothetical protein
VQAAWSGMVRRLRARMLRPNRALASTAKHAPWPQFCELRPMQRAVTACLNCHGRGPVPLRCAPEHSQQPAAASNLPVMRFCLGELPGRTAAAPCRIICTQLFQRCSRGTRYL